MTFSAECSTDGRSWQPAKLVAATPDAEALLYAHPGADQPARRMLFRFVATRP